MYSDYFGLKTSPFSISPDPDFLFLSPHHQEALAHLIFGMKDQGGFIVLTGEVGTGKTTLIRTLLERRDEQTYIALVLNPRLNEIDFIETICDELKISYTENSSLKDLNDKLNAYLLERFAENHFVVVIIDEAQHLSDELLERIRLLTNLETNKHRLLKVILVGQPELRFTLEKQELRQVAQRITARYHLHPLSAAQTQTYIYHRLAIAGCSRPVFSPATFNVIYKYTQGIPRLINVLCDRSLLGAYTENAHQVIKEHVLRAAAELFLVNKPRRSKTSFIRVMSFITLIIFAILLGALGTYFFKNASTQKQTTESVHNTAKNNTDALSEIIAKSTDKIPEQLNVQNKIDRREKIDIVAQNEKKLANSGKSSDEYVLNNAEELQSRILAKGNRLEPFWRNLALWEIPEAPNPAIDRCDAIYKGHGLACYSGILSFDLIKKINLPTLLVLQTNDGTRELLLRSIQGEKVIIDSESQEITSTIDTLSLALKKIWDNKVLIIWRPPFGRVQIGPGDQGQAVELMIKQLSLANGQKFAQEKIYDGEIFETIKHFQEQNNLTPDGIASAQTLLYLNHWTELQLVRND